MKGRTKPDHLVQTIAHRLCCSDSRASVGAELHRCFTPVHAEARPGQANKHWQLLVENLVYAMLDAALGATTFRHGHNLIQPTIAVMARLECLVSYEIGVAKFRFLPGLNGISESLIRNHYAIEEQVNGSIIVGLEADSHIQTCITF